ncbi:MAG: hypothetical protein AB7Q17_03315 [Phycisphaerae bacterium]
MAQAISPRAAPAKTVALAAWGQVIQRSPLGHLKNPCRPLQKTRIPRRSCTGGARARGFFKGHVRECASRRQQIFYALEVAWIETTAFLSKTWTNFTSDVQEAWHLVQNWLTKRWIDVMNLFGDLTDEQAAAKQTADQDFADTAAGIEQRRSGALREREERRKPANAKRAIYCPIVTLPCGAIKVTGLEYVACSL